MIIPKPVLDYCYGFEKIDELDFEKGNGLIPAVIQNAQTGQVLIVGYMNKEALQKTISSRFVTFFQRDRFYLVTDGPTVILCL